MNLIKKLLIAGSCAIVLGGCKKDGLEPDNNFIYKMDGVLKTAVPEGTNFSDGSFMVDATTDDGDDVTLFIDDNNIRIGTFHIENAEDETAASYNSKKHPEMLFSDSGLLVITSYNGSNVSGTFHFQVRDGQNIKKFTGGQFRAKVSFFSLPEDEPCYEDTTYDIAAKKKWMLQQIRPSSVVK